MAEIQKFGRYEILEVLGKGAMGTVYKARDPLIDRILALKTIRHEVIADDETSQEVRKRFLQEAKIAGRLSHPGIVTIFDLGVEGEDYFIAMEYIEGTPLGELINSRELNLDQILNIMVQICDAVEFAHQHNVIHRDLKPANLMVLHGGRIKIMDFGIARMESSHLTTTGQALGTPSYMSPEQISGGDIDQRSDLFSLGVILYQMLTGEKPFKGDTITRIIFAIINSTPAPPSEVTHALPVYFDEVVSKALQKEKENRFQSAAEFRRAIQQYYKLPAAARPSGKDVRTEAEKTALRQNYQAELAGAEPTADVTQPRLKQQPAKALAPKPSPSAARPLRVVFIVLLALFFGLGITLAYFQYANKTGPWEKINLWVLKKMGKDAEGVQAKAEGEQVAPAPAPPVTTMITSSVPPPVKPTTTLTTSAPPTSVAPVSPSPPEKKPAETKTAALPASPPEPPKSEPPAEINAGGNMLLIKWGGHPSFLIDKYEVTNEQYLAFIKATGHRYPTHWENGTYSLGEDDYPVNNIAWADAMAYARWAGKTLPSLEQWRWAARADTDNTYPWGSSFNAGAVNCCNRVRGTSSVSYYSEDRSPYGVIGMGGNVSEWTSTPAGGGDSYYIAGGNFKSSQKNLSATSVASLDGQNTKETVGFRCVKKP